jgi:cellulose synthase/poly-beta-1,6-N-acetylglucosamine synthase-like glycosyltransferase
MGDPTMIEWFIWGASFFSLYIGIFWLHVILLKEERKNNVKYFPFVSIIVPSWNVENCLWKTVHSIISLDYPKDKIEVIIVNHGSTDNTGEIARQMKERFSSFNIKIVYKERALGHMKAHAFNEGLKYATGEYIACIDADTIVMKDSLKNIMPYFLDKEIGAAISNIKVWQPKNIFEKLQHLEYIFSTFTRKLMSKIDTLQITHGALSVYRKEIFDKYGGFDEHNITEDFEIAMRIRYQGYRVILAQDSITYTCVPNTFKWFWRQRVRWFRGFIYNTLKYRKITFKKKYGLLGSFQQPVNILTIGVIVFMLGLMTYSLSERIYTFLYKIITLGWGYFSGWEIPTIKQVIYNQNVTLLFPILFSILVGLIIYHLAHKNLKEKWKYPEALFCYLTIYPIVRSFQWMNAVYEEALKARKKW